MDINDIIFGRDKTENIVCLEPKDDQLVIFTENNGKVEQFTTDHFYWILSNQKMGQNTVDMYGDLYYKYAVTFEKYRDYKAHLQSLYKYNQDFYTIYDQREAAMVTDGMTYFKNMKPNDVSVLSFDIETSGLVHDRNSKIYLISNTFRRNGKTEKKLFAFDEFNSQKEMLESWAAWVRKKDPSILLGHNIFMFDIPYLNYCAQLSGASLNLGRDNSVIKFNKKLSKFRKDGSQEYEYNNCRVYGRELIDTMFLAIKYDIQRNYESYGLKAIIAHEGLEAKDRQFYDAGLIREKHKDPEEWKKIKKYAIDDADDALKLFDLMIPSYFYYTQSIPKPFQQIINSATGSQLNSYMVRAYLQEEHSLPKASEAAEYEGAISWGRPGIYKNVVKSDIASLYPSIMRQYKVEDKEKDPKGIFQTTVNYFTEQRLNNKRLGKETGNRYYKDMEQSQKIVINSLYGFLGASGLLFNSPKNAAFITRKGREILQRSIYWATGKTYKEWNPEMNFKTIGKEEMSDIDSVHDFILVNCDTDSLSYCKSDMKAFTADEINELLDELNSYMDKLIVFEDDGYFDKLIVVKAKNYVMKEGNNIKYKGSAIKATSKEKALQMFIKEVIDLFLTNKTDHLFFLYNSYIKDIRDGNIDIKDWVSKKTITSKILNPERTNEQKVLDAIKDIYVQEGDKIYTFFKPDGSLCLLEHFNGEYCKDTLYNKVYKTLEVFSNLIDTSIIPNYKTKRNKLLLDKIL